MSRRLVALAAVVATVLAAADSASAESATDRAVAAARRSAQQLPRFVVDPRSLAHKRFVGVESCSFGTANVSRSFGLYDGFVPAFCRGRTALEGFSAEVFLVRPKDLPHGTTPFSCHREGEGYTCVVAYRANRLMVIVSDVTKLRAARMFRAMARTVSRYARPIHR
jgi:hypothetical protein